MSENLFMVVATPANQNFHPIYVKAENEEKARQLFCEYFSIPSGYRDGICRAEPIDVQNIPAPMPTCFRLWEHSTAPDHAAFFQPNPPAWSVAVFYPYYFV